MEEKGSGDIIFLVLSSDSTSLLNFQNQLMFPTFWHKLFTTKICGNTPGNVTMLLKKSYNIYICLQYWELVSEEGERDMFVTKILEGKRKRKPKIRDY